MIDGTIVFGSAPASSIWATANGSRWVSRLHRELAVIL
jgi:hypothetical protein